MRCPDKKAYDTEEKAFTALFVAWKYRTPNQKSPERVYECNQCHKWHLTSKKVNTYAY